MLCIDPLETSKLSPPPPPSHTPRWCAQGCGNLTSVVNLTPYRRLMVVVNLRSRGCVEVMVQKLQDIKGQRHSFETLLLKLKREGLQSFVWCLKVNILFCSWNCDPFYINQYKSYTWDTVEAQHECSRVSKVITFLRSVVLRRRAFPL